MFSLKKNCSSNMHSRLFSVQFTVTWNHFRVSESQAFQRKMTLRRCCLCMGAVQKESTNIFCCICHSMNMSVMSIGGRGRGRRRPSAGAKLIAFLQNCSSVEIFDSSALAVFFLLITTAKFLFRRYTFNHIVVSNYAFVSKYCLIWNELCARNVTNPHPQFR